MEILKKIVIVFDQCIYIQNGYQNRYWHIKEVLKITKKAIYLKNPAHEISSNEWKGGFENRAK